jgi:hypothetical protein
VGILSPWFLLASASLAVPVFLHLFQKRRPRKMSFPALRYLERTEREHAREIRLRQRLLLAARLAALALLVFAGARPVWRGAGTSHPPTAVVIVLDNSLSSGLVVGEERVLDGLKRVAERAIDAVGPEDVVWVLRAGEPWRPTWPGGGDEARAAVRATEPTAARGDLSASLRRAAELLATSELDQREIHLLSDLQATGFDEDPRAPVDAFRVVVWLPERPAQENRALTEAMIGGGLPPVEGQTSEVAIRLEGPIGASPPVGVRVLEGERIRAATALAPGSALVLPLPASGPGWIVGTVEADPDALSADDRRFFAYRSRPAPVVAVSGDPGLFVTEGLEVLREAGRVRYAPGQAATLTVSVGGAALEQIGRDGAALVVPSSDPTLVPALNRRLQTAGVPWRYRVRAATGGTTLAGTALPPGLEGVRASVWLELQPAGDAVRPSRVLAEIAGAPWAVETAAENGARVLLLGSPLDARASTLPVSPGLVRFLDWASSVWAAGGSEEDRNAGDPLPAPAAADRVETPHGASIVIDGTRMVTATGVPGHYTFLAGDSVVSVVAVNPPATESTLAPLPREYLPTAVGPGAVPVSDPEAWSKEIFGSTRGAEIWGPILWAAILVLLAESLLAAASPVRTASPRTSRFQVTGDGAP